MAEETLKMQVEWCIENIKTIAEAINKGKKVVLSDEPPDEPTDPNPKP